MLHLKPMCRLKPKSMHLLLYCLQGLTPLSKHTITVSLPLCDGPFWCLRLLPQDPNSIIMLSIGLRSRSQSPGCQGFQVLPTPPSPSMLMASKATIPSLTAPRTLTPSQGFHQIGSRAISREAITHACYMIKGAFSLICVLTLKLLLDYRAWKKHLTAFAMLVHFIL